jgi:hypothetical protein
LINSSKINDLSKIFTIFSIVIISSVVPLYDALSGLHF